MWVWSHARGEDVSIADITQRFVTLDDTTRAVPDQRSVEVYRELQGLFDETARDLSGVFARHRRLLAGGVQAGVRLV
jgi:hypothetical protein